MPFWIAARTPDAHAAFRGHFTLDTNAEFELRTLGASFYELRLDGDFLLEGPLRYTPAHAEYTSTNLALHAGDHVISVHAVHHGVPTRMLENIPPFLDVRLFQGDTEIPLTWKAAQLTGFRPTVRRINPELGWIEWCDTRQLPDFHAPTFDDAKWTEPATVEAPAGVPPTIDPPRRVVHGLQPLAQGTLTNAFGYELDDPPAAFFLRDLSPKLPPQGVWRRYDLGQVRLGKLALTLDLPADSVVEVAYSEDLAHGRVNPFISLSTGQSCNLDHWVARGGVQTFTSLESRGGRYAEVHVIAPPGKVAFVKEQYHERTYHNEPMGSFRTDDQTLNRVWQIGLNAYRACSEDAIIDNPTRERGQWTGDAYIGMETAAVAYDDLRLARRALLHAAQNAGGDGMVSGLTPGHSPLSTYALQWTGACIRYHQLTGDRQFLEDLFPAAVKNLHAFDPHVTKDGLADVGWAFIDWGYARPPGPTDAALNVHYLLSLRGMRTWCGIHGWKEDAKPYADRESDITALLSPRFGKENFESLGYHASALGLRADLVPAGRVRECVAYIKGHWLNCFPNNPDAPRLSDPGAASSQMVTPYFAHWAFPALIEHGEMDFVLEQYRSCWGWMLSEGATTTYEVFDPRWSHCHQWSAAPTSQMSRYCLGLHRRFDVARNHFDLILKPGSLKGASGELPQASVKWVREGDRVRYTLSPKVPVTYAVNGRERSGVVDGETTFDVAL